MIPTPRPKIWLFVLASLQAGCSLTGRGLDPGPAAATRIGYVRSTALPDPESARDTAKLAGDFPVDLSALLVNSTQTTDRQLTDLGMPVVCQNRTTNELRELKEGPCNPNEVAALSSKVNIPLELARKIFYATCGSPQSCGDARNRVQDRLIWASENACTDYLVQVRRSFTATNLNLGTATTLFGALGAVLTSADATRVFSGASAFTSGLRAEYNDVYFSSQAFELVSRAIRSVREKARKQIADYRNANRDIQNYTLDGAVSDAMRYHGTCNVMAGLEEAADAITRDRDPGLKRLSELLQDVSSSATVSLGAAVLDTGNLPSATRSCLSLRDQEGLVDAQIVRIDDEIKRLSSLTPPPSDKVALLTSLRQRLTSQKGNVQKMVGEVQACAKKNDGTTPADTAEKSMYEAVRVFTSSPLADKQIRRQQFESEKASVLSIKLDIDRRIARISEAIIAMRNEVDNALTKVRS